MKISKTKSEGEIAYYAEWKDTSVNDYVLKISKTKSQGTIKIRTDKTGLKISKTKSYLVLLSRYFYLVENKQD